MVVMVWWERARDLVLRYTKSAHRIGESKTEANILGAIGGGGRRELGQGDLKGLRGGGNRYDSGSFDPCRNDLLGDKRTSSDFGHDMVSGLLKLILEERYRVCFVC